MSEAPRIDYIRVRDSFGIEDFELAPQKITIVSGDNGTGKTSLRRSVHAVFAGGTDPSMIRQGAERSVIEIHLSDQTTIQQITRPKRARVYDDGGGFVSDLLVKLPDGSHPHAPRTYLRRLATSTAIDPAGLLRIDAATTTGMNKLTEEFYKLMPLTFEPDQIRELLRYQDVVALDGPVSGYTGMKWVDHYVPVMAWPMPPPADEITLDVLKRISEGIAEKRTAAGRVADQSGKSVKSMRESLAQASLRCQDCLREEIEHQLVSAWTAEWQHSRLGDIVVDLERLRKKKFAENLPTYFRTAGVTVERGQVLVDGVPWTNVNTARRIDVICEICSQLAGELKFIMIDDANLLSENTMRMLEERLLARNFQILLIVVTRTKLTVSTRSAA